MWIKNYYPLLAPHNDKIIGKYLLSSAPDPEP
jgi:hypothetical protein